MKSVFLLHHSHVFSEDNESEKFIGVYASEQDAFEAIERLKTQPGFSEYPKLLDPYSTDDVDESGFFISECELGKDHWVEGYVTED